MLTRAVQRGSVRLTELLLRHGASAAELGWAAGLAASSRLPGGVLGGAPMLWHAVRGRHVRVARLLIDARADVHFAPKQGFYDGVLQCETQAATRAMTSEWTPAFYGGSTGTPPDGGLTPYSDFTSMLRLLLESGADPNTLEDDGETTPLWHAVAARKLDRVDLLLRHGADPQRGMYPPYRIIDRYNDRLWTTMPLAWDEALPEFRCVLRAALERIPQSARLGRIDVDGVTEGYAIARRLVAADASRGELTPGAPADKPRSDAERAWSTRLRKPPRGPGGERHRAAVEQAQGAARTPTPPGAGVARSTRSRPSTCRRPAPSTPSCSARGGGRRACTFSRSSRRRTSSTWCAAAPTSTRRGGRAWRGCRRRCSAPRRSARCPSARPGRARPRARCWCSRAGACRGTGCWASATGSARCC